jgi:hypothetical protein
MQANYKYNVKYIYMTETKVPDWNINNVDGKRLQGALKKLILVGSLNQDEVNNLTIYQFKKLIMKKLRNLEVAKEAIDKLSKEISDANRNILKKRQLEEKNSDEIGKIEENIEIWSAERIILQQEFFANNNITSMSQSQDIGRALLEIRHILDGIELTTFEVNEVNFNQIPANAFILNPSCKILLIVQTLISKNLMTPRKQGRNFMLINRLSWINKVIIQRQLVS